MHARISGQSLAEKLRRSQDWVDLNCAQSFYVGLPLNSINCSLKTKSLWSLLTVKLTVSLQLSSTTRTRRTWMSETKSRRQEPAYVLSNTFNAALTWCVQCARTMCTAVCVCVCVFLSCGNLSSVLFLLHIAASLLREWPLSQSLAKAQLSSESWITMWESISCLNPFWTSSTIPGFALSCTLKSFKNH